MVLRRAGPAERQRGADLAEAAQLGEDYGLGACQAVAREQMYQDWQKPVGAFAGLLVVFGVVGFVLALSMAAHHWHGGLYAVLALAGTALGLALWRTVRSRPGTERLYRYDGGLIQLAGDSREPRVLRWDEAESVTMSFTYDPEDGEDGYRLRGCTVQDRAGTNITATSVEADFKTVRGYEAPVPGELAAAAGWVLAPRLVAPLIWAWESGEPVPVGDHIQISQAGITRLSARAGEEPEFTAWNEISSIVMNPGRGVGDPIATIAVRRVGKRRNFVFDLAGVRNGIIVPRLIKHTAERNGLAAQEDPAAKASPGPARPDEAAGRWLTDGPARTVLTRWNGQTAAGP